MFNIRFQNLPKLVFNPRLFAFEPAHVDTLRQVIGTLLICPPELPQLLIERSEFFILEDKSLVAAPVRIIVEWYSERPSSDTIFGLALAFYNFLKAYGFEAGLTVIFSGISEGDAFIEKDGRLISAPRLPTPHFNYRGFQGKR